MISPFSQNIIGYVGIGTPSISASNISTYIFSIGFGARLSSTKTLSSVTAYIAKTGSPADADLPLYVVSSLKGRPYQTVTITTGSASISLAGNRLSNGDQILLFGSGLPGGASARGTVYYVVNVATDTFELSLTNGGSAITWSSAGTTVAIAKYVDKGTTNMSNVTGSSTYKDFTGFTCSLTAGKMYYFMLLNNNATPGSNYLSWGFATKTLETLDMLPRFSSNNLTTFTQSIQDIGLNGSINFSDSTSIEYRVTSASSNFRIDADSSTNVKYRGTSFTTAPGAKINLAGVAWKILVTIGATPISKDYVVDLLDNSNSLIATSTAINILDLENITMVLSFYFTTIQTLEPSTTYKIRLRTTYTGSDTTNYLGLYYFVFNAGANGTSYFDQVWNNGAGSALYFIKSFYANPTESDLLQHCLNVALILNDYTPYNTTGGNYAFAY